MNENARRPHQTPRRPVRFPQRKCNEPKRITFKKRHNITKGRALLGIKIVQVMTNIIVFMTGCFVSTVVLVSSERAMVWCRDNAFFLSNSAGKQPLRITTLTWFSPVSSEHTHLGYVTLHLHTLNLFLKRPVVYRRGINSYSFACHMCNEV